MAEKPQKTAIVNIGQLVTATAKGIEVTKGANLVFEDGVISSIGHSSDVASTVDEKVDALGGVVLPGFIDAHTHLVFGGNRASELELKAQGKSYQEIAAAGGGIMSTVRQTRELDEHQMLEVGLKHLTWCLRNGTTTLEAKSGYGLDLSTETNLLLALHHIDAAFCESVKDKPGSRVIPTFLGLHALAPEFDDREKYVSHVIDEILPVIAGAGLAKYVDAFVETGYFTPEDAARLAAKASSLGLGVKLHVDQITDGDGARLATELGAVTADHLEQTSAKGIKALAESKTIPVLLPASVFGLGLNKFPDARAMIDAGLPVVLATDFNPGSSPTPSIPFVMAIAVRFMKMTPEEALVAVTVNAAKSLRLTDRGRLEAGMKADFSVWPLTDWREVMGWIDGPRPSQVWVNGTRVN